MSDTKRQENTRKVRPIDYSNGCKVSSNVWRDGAKG